MLTVLDLFSGHESFSEVCRRLPQFFTVTTLEKDPKFKADITCDILKWSYKDYAPGQFDIIWASPPCTEYSIAKSRGVRDLELADKIVKRTLKIIKYLQPKIWFLENPQTGMLKDRGMMKNIPYYDVCYCKYGYPYKKPTRIWTNLKDFKPLNCRQDCTMIVGGKHIQRNGGPSMVPYVMSKHKATIPPKLVRALLKATMQELKKPKEESAVSKLYIKTIDWKRILFN